MGTVKLRPRGSEVIARHPGRCGLCPRRILPGQPLIKLPVIGWTHTSCGDGYRRVLAEHGVEETRGR